MHSGLSFLIAALRSEIAELDQLGRTSEVVGTLGELVHALQRERGMSNVYLASGAQRFAEERVRQIAQCERETAAVLAGFARLESESARIANASRLFNRIASVLPMLAALPELRRRITIRALDAGSATAAFNALVARLLAVVFEAADGASAPEISRCLVALFNFMQGKEYAGQERACGAAAFASGHNDGTRQQHWLHLIEAQERCFELFAGVADPAATAAWTELQTQAQRGELERLRRIACAAPAGIALDPERSLDWFACCSARIDAMKRVEDCLTLALRTACQRQMAAAREELARREALQARMAASDPAADPRLFDEAFAPAHISATLPALPDPQDAPGYGRQLGRSILELVHEQGQRLQAMSEEVQTIRAALHERKLVERAKGLLMAHRQLSEDAAHRMLRQTAMNQNRRLVDVAESVLALADFLPAEPRR